MLTMGQRRAVTSSLRKRYQQSSKKAKTQILNEFTALTGYNRSYARYLLGRKRVAKRRRKNFTAKKRGQKRKYDLAVFYVLRKLWLISDCICSQRLKPFLPELINQLEQWGELSLNPQVKAKLLTISPATMDRMLSNTKKSYQLKARKGKTTTKPGSILKSQIPIKTFADWQKEREQPGFFETDLVAFCGSNSAGEYVNGLNLTDIATGWVLLDAVMGKGQRRVFQAIDQARKRVCFPILGLNPDNGSEFINWHLYRYCCKHQITFTRIRPGRKNDNAHVEQKNYTVLRRFIGYARLETNEQLKTVKAILKLVENYVNFFQPSIKLKQKVRFGTRVKKWYDSAKTPYQRLKLSGILSKRKEQQLTNHYRTLNPLDLKRRINHLQTKLLKTFR